MLPPSKPPRPGLAPSLGLRAGTDGILLVSQTTSRKEMNMWLQALWQRWLDRPATGRARPAPRRHRPRLTLEYLEDRSLLSIFNAATVSDLIADINAANLASGSNTIILTAPTSSPYVLTAVNNTTDGATGLPVVNNRNHLTIVGNGDTIERSSDAGTPSFRLFDVARTGSLTLQNVTLRNGLAFGSGKAADGGAIYNQGTLALNAVAMQNNTAFGSDGQSAHTKNSNGKDGEDAAGGGIWSNGSLTLQGGTTLQGNKAIGGAGGSAYLNYDCYCWGAGRGGS